MSVLRNDFYSGLFEKRTVQGVFKNIQYTGLKYGSAEYIEPLIKTSKVPSTLRVHFVPDYLIPEIKAPYQVFKSYHVEGFAIELEGHQSLEEYIAGHLKPRLRTSVRNNPGKLEKDYVISYQWYYGDIQKSTYDTLMEEIRVMLLSRFTELDKTNERISEWARLLPIIYPLILNKQASIFVVRDSGKPIAASVNYHMDPVFCLFIPAFDPDYSKYGLGHVLISKQLEWCLRNNYKLFDMMRGDLRYKRDWCNRVYKFHTWVLYDASNISAKCRAYFLHQMQLIKMQLKIMGVDQWYKAMMEFYHRIKNMKLVSNK